MNVRPQLLQRPDMASSTLKRKQASDVAHVTHAEVAAKGPSYVRRPHDNIRLSREKRTSRSLEIGKSSLWLRHSYFIIHWPVVICARPHTDEWFAHPSRWYVPSDKIHHYTL